MSSAILYLAIVAIWACVLIPRWLRRDSARGVPGPVVAPVVAEPSAVTDEGSAEDADEAVVPIPIPIPAPVRAAEPPSAEESRRRMLAARRRLLLMLIGLEIAAISLAVLGLAAIWVVVPPSIMLVGYLLLLREAGKADTERVQYEAEVAARARERTQAHLPQGHRPGPQTARPQTARLPTASPGRPLPSRRSSPPHPSRPTTRTPAATSRRASPASTRPRTRTPNSRSWTSPLTTITTRPTNRPGSAPSATSPSCFLSPELSMARAGRKVC